MCQKETLQHRVAVALTARQLFAGICPSTYSTVKSLLDTSEKRLSLAEQLQDVLANTLAQRPEWNPAFFCYAVVAKVFQLLDSETP